MTTKTYPKVSGMDLCKSNGKNAVFEARINKVRSGSRMWLGFGVACLHYTVGISLYRDPLYGNLYMMPIPQVEIDI